MLKLVEDIIKALVDEPNEVVVSEKVEQVKGKEGEETFTATIFDVAVSRADSGKVIGKKGELANAIRTILRALGGKNKQPMLLRIKDHRPQNNQGGQ